MKIPNYDSASTNRSNMPSNTFRMLICDKNLEPPPPKFKDLLDTFEPISDEIKQLDKFLYLLNIYENSKL